MVSTVCEMRAVYLNYEVITSESRYEFYFLSILILSILIQLRNYMKIFLEYAVTLILLS